MSRGGESYQLTQRWTHPPILWAAIDETLPGERGDHGDHGDSVGGGASGHW